MKRLYLALWAALIVFLIALPTVPPASAKPIPKNSHHRPR